MGKWQFEFLRGQGLVPQDYLLDVGCGALRGGIHFVAYLEPGHYAGIDCNASYVEVGGRLELTRAGLEDRRPSLLANVDFEVGRFGRTFNFALAQSLFTHLPVNAIQRCLVNVTAVLQPGGRFFATYFDAPTVHHLDRIQHPSGVETYSDRNPYHYHASIFAYLATSLPLRVESLGLCNHPRGQSMLVFHRS
ncbi:MAG: class I SAM-dependent methyltransferase [Planctomycetia bacterium]|nr:class I SAM-dependent methyltransferase [Planctomycetia bacterium]